MQRYAVRVRVFAALFAAALMLSLFGSPARAADAAYLAHRAIRGKLLREASDRYGVAFLTTHIDRLQGPWRQVTGKGVFRRHRNTGQNFSYSTNVNIRNNADKNTGYTIRK
jgi:hypothetical protein